MIELTKEYVEANPYIPENIKKTLYGEYPLGWQMNDAERSTLINLVSSLKPSCAIEVGTAFGGSLYAISQYSEKVYSLDFDSSQFDTNDKKFSNVEFITGDSNNTLPLLLERLQAEGISPEFILIDADHSYDGVKRDIENLLKIQPLKPLYVLMHDGFMPDCRKGIKDADWASNPFVHFVEVDFVPGTLTSRPDIYGFMIGGFALALLLPEKREGDLEIRTDYKLTFQTLYANSEHRPDGIHSNEFWEGKAWLEEQWKNWMLIAEDRGKQLEENATLINNLERDASFYQKRVQESQRQLQEQGAWAREMENTLTALKSSPLYRLQTGLGHFLKSSLKRFKR